MRMYVGRGLDSVVDMEPEFKPLPRRHDPESALDRQRPGRWLYALRVIAEPCAYFCAGWLAHLWLTGP